MVHNLSLQMAHRRARLLSSRSLSERDSSSTGTLPSPPVPLKDHCSVINNNVLYTFQPDAFQSLELGVGEQWHQLSMGVSTSGSSCVRGSSNSQDALYIVGGATNSSMQNYPGLQVYTFRDQKWQTLVPLVPVTQNRQKHGATYLNATSSILIYGGSQNNGYSPSSETFLISTNPPYNVQAFSSDAPPVIQPLLLPFNESHAIMLGGDTRNKQLWTFGPKAGWQWFNASLETGLPSSSQAQASLLDNGKGGKLLEVFDLSRSPNQVTSLILQGTNDLFPSNVVSPGKTKPQKRDGNSADWPAYNSSLAPTATRNGFSLAQDKSGLVVASGGNNQEPISIFNQTGNQWIDANQFFGTTTPSTSSTPTPTASPTTSPAGSHEPSNRGKVLGGTLGGLLGAILLLVLIIFLLLCLRKRQEKKRQNQMDGGYGHDGDRMDFSDRGVDFMKDAGGSFARSAGTSPPMVSGPLGPPMMTHRADVASQKSKRKLFHKQGDSDGSAKSFFSRGKSPTTSSPPMISEPILIGTPDPRAEPRTDTGWSRYFANNSANNLGPGNPRHELNSRHTSTSHSDYTSSSRGALSHAHESAEVQPLNLRPNQPLLQTTSSAPGGHPTGLTVSHSAEPPTPTTTSSSVQPQGDYLENIPESDGTSSWTPIETGDRLSTWEERPASSAYADSVVYPHPGERVRIPNFPRVPSSSRISVGTTDPVQNGDGPGFENVVHRGTPTLSASNGRRLIPVSAQRAEVHSLSRSIEDAEIRPQEAAPQDMSWLNLG